MKKTFKGNIYLIGFMGSGKSTIAPKIAKIMNRPFFDSDSWIENKTGKSISQIFKEEGEDSFRKIEKDCLKMVSQMEQLVVSIGGGAIMFSENWINLKKSGIIIYLKCSFETLWLRIQNSVTRPLLPQDKNERYQEIKKLLVHRAPYYERADIIFPCKEGESPDKIAEQLIKQIRTFF